MEEMIVDESERVDVNQGIIVPVSPRQQLLQAINTVDKIRMALKTHLLKLSEFNDIVPVTLGEDYGWLRALEDLGWTHMGIELAPELLIAINSYRTNTLALLDCFEVLAMAVRMDARVITAMKKAERLVNRIQPIDRALTALGRGEQWMAPPKLELEAGEERLADSRLNTPERVGAAIIIGQRRIMEVREERKDGLVFTFSRKPRLLQGMTSQVEVGSGMDSYRDRIGT